MQRREKCFLSLISVSLFFFFFWVSNSWLQTQKKRKWKERKWEENERKEKKRERRNRSKHKNWTSPPFFFFFCWSYGFLGRFAAAFSLLNFVFPPPLGAIVVVGRGGGVDGVVWRWVGVTPGWLEEGGVVWWSCLPIGLVLLLFALLPPPADVCLPSLSLSLSAAVINYQRPQAMTTRLPSRPPPPPLTHPFVLHLGKMSCSLT